MKIEKIPILDVGISQITLQKIPLFINASFKKKNYGYVTITGAHGLIESTKFKKIKNAHQNSLLSVADGMPLVWISKLKGSNEVDRCFGPDVFDIIMKDKILSKKNHFLYGGNDGVADKLKINLENKYDANIVGTYTPPFRALNKKEMSVLSNEIEITKADIIWVGLSCPKQELFMYENFKNLNVKFMFGIGAAFDYQLGTIIPAPKLIQNLGLEWLYRLIQEPKRLYRRYLEIVPKFILLSLVDFFKKK
jgi:N-acetylglucosaminyldiphosphoundecaprenol N-acetyl-beta-D-mannosaminyltransferase